MSDERTTIREVEEFLRDTLWMLGPPTTMPSSTVTVDGLQAAIRSLTELKKIMLLTLPRQLFLQLRMKGHTSVNALRDLADNDPRIRDIAIVDMALFSVKAAKKMIEENGQLPVQLPKLARTKRHQ